ncbi:TIGR00725 family protein [Ornithinimicrobium panacihumi]|uniref:TIGR00725 family protein n=1 Tax=Ornithinimicrobium panacihumi TaxID=2008449 RepID=UPI003F8CDD76
MSYVGVVGPGQGATAELVQLAVEVGRLLARQGFVVVTGGLGGVMAGAARGCSETGGTSIGLLPGDDRATANPHLTLTIPTGMGEMRNALLVRSSDAIIAVGSSWGTLSEIALARRTGVPVVLVEADHLLTLEDETDGAPSLVLADGPEQAVEQVCALLRPERSSAPAADPSGSRGRMVDPWVLGADGSRGGWVGALLPISGTGEVRLVSAPDIRTLVDRATQQATLAAVGIDTPIGLPETGPRRADQLARQRLGHKASSVFNTPVRDALSAETYAEARAISVERTGGTSLSAQSYGLRRAILDVDGFVRSGTRLRVVEVHPELSFARMAGEPLPTKKRQVEGAVERLGVLRASGITVPSSVDLEGRDVHDLLDAAAVAWSAARVARGEADRIPDPPERFGDGLDAAIWV